MSFDNRKRSFHDHDNYNNYSNYNKRARNDGLDGAIRFEGGGYPRNNDFNQR